MAPVVMSIKLDEYQKSLATLKVSIRVARLKKRKILIRNQKVTISYLYPYFNSDTTAKQ
jgi:hypothetical protein